VWDQVTGLFVSPVCENAETTQDTDKKNAQSMGSSTASGNIARGKSQAPPQGEPNSTYEQVDDKGNLRSRTHYNENGQAETRDDFDHEHFDKKTQRYLKLHRHTYKYNEKGQPIGETVIPIPINWLPILTNPI
jgi:uncharacterized protein YxeA